MIHSLGRQPGSVIDRIVRNDRANDPAGMQRARMRKGIRQTVKFTV